jgi:probable phosphoglycerate mutase
MRIREAEQGIGRKNILVFSHGHMLRFVAASFLKLPSPEARIFNLATASVSILGYDHNLMEPVIKLWNDTSHLA